MNISPTQVIDILLFAVLLVSVVKGYKEGFFTSLIRLTGNIGSLFAGLWVSNNYAPVLFEKFLRGPLTERAFNYLTKLSRNIDIKTAISGVLGNFPPQFLSTVLEKTEDALAVIITPDMNSAVLLVDEFLAPVVTSVISVVLFIVTAIAVKIICNILAVMFKAVNKVPVLGTANKLAGLITGVVTGGINIIFLSFILSIIVIVTGDSISFLNTETVSKSRILSLTGMVNPFLG